MANPAAEQVQQSILLPRPWQPQGWGVQAREFCDLYSVRGITLLFGGLAVLCNANSQTIPSNRTDAVFAQDCRCNLGYSHRPPDYYDTNTIVSDNVCYACTPGYYNADLGKMECSPCGPGYFSPMHISLCVDNCDTCFADMFLCCSRETVFLTFSRKKSTISCGWQGYKTAAKPVIDRKDAVLAIE